MEADEAKVAEEVKRAQEQNAVGEVWHNTALKQYEVPCVSITSWVLSWVLLFLEWSHHYQITRTSAPHILI